MDSRHPLDPLTLDEIQQACQILKDAKPQIKEGHHKFVQVELEEPEKIDKTKIPHRIAFICILDAKHNETFEANIDLTLRKLIRWEKLPFNKYPYGQAPILQSDYGICDRAVKEDKAWRDAMKKRGLTESQIDLIQVDPFAPGYFNRAEEKGKRLVRAVSFFRENESDNAYAHPIEGVVAVVDLIKQSVMRVYDDGRNTPIPRKTMNYDADAIKNKRAAPKPLDIIQPEGPSFTVDGWHVNGLGWDFRVGFTRREGLALHNVTFDGRSIFRRVSVPEMVVPYADPSENREFHAAFDGGENGFGSSANELKLGCDCLGHIHYFDVAMADESGNKKIMKNVICLHEEDDGTLWKHTDTRRGICEVRRGRRLVIGYAATLENYDYIIYFYAGADGSFRIEIKPTGIVQTAAIFPNTPYEWGSILTEGLAAPAHQHLYCARLETAVDGENNSVAVSQVVPLPRSAKNPNGIAFGIKKRILTSENEVCAVNTAAQQSLIIFNPNVKNSVGEPVAYKVELPHDPLLLADGTSEIGQRAGYAKRRAWVTPFHRNEKYPSGDYPNQHAGLDGVPKYVQQKRSIVNKRLVLWLTFGPTHIPRLEDAPVMPVATTSITFTPYNFFNRNPAIDLPPQCNKKSVQNNPPRAKL